MNVKSGILSLGAAAVLSLSMFTGASAAATTDVQITFQSTGCVFTVNTNEETHNMGIWQWNDNNGKYELGSASVNISYQAAKSAPGIESCEYVVSLEGGAMVGTNPENTIPADKFQWENVPLDPTAPVVTANTSGVFKIGQPETLTDIKPDTYTGTLNFTAGTGS